MTQTGGKKKVRRRTTKRKPAKRKAPVRRRKTTKRKAPARRRVTKKSSRSKPRKRTTKRKTTRRRTQRGGSTHALPKGIRPGHGPTALRNMHVRRVGEQDILSRGLVGTNTGKSDNKRFIRPPTMDMPPHVQMDPMNDISAYLSDYYMNVDVERLARQMYGDAVHAVHNQTPGGAKYHLN